MDIFALSSLVDEITHLGFNLKNISFGISENLFRENPTPTLGPVASLNGEWIYSAGSTFATLKVFYAVFEKIHLVDMQRSRLQKSLVKTCELVVKIQDSLKGVYTFWESHGPLSKKMLHLVGVEKEAHEMIFKLARGAIIEWGRILHPLLLDGEMQKRISALLQHKIGRGLSLDLPLVKCLNKAHKIILLEDGAQHKFPKKLLTALMLKNVSPSQETKLKEWVKALNVWPRYASRVPSPVRILHQALKIFASKQFEDETNPEKKKKIKSGLTSFLEWELEKRGCTLFQLKDPEHAMWVQNVIDKKIALRFGSNEPEVDVKERYVGRPLPLAHGRVKAFLVEGMENSIVRFSENGSELGIRLIADQPIEGIREDWRKEEAPQKLGPRRAFCIAPIESFIDDKSRFDLVYFENYFRLSEYPWGQNERRDEEVTGQLDAVIIIMCKENYTPLSLWPDSVLIHKVSLYLSTFDILLQDPFDVGRIRAFIHKCSPIVKWQNKLLDVLTESLS